LPQLVRDQERLDLGFLPPCALVAVAVKLPVMKAAQWYRVFIADLAAERAHLRKSQMVRFGGRAPADETRLSRYEFPVKLVAHARGLLRPQRCPGRGFVHTGARLSTWRVVAVRAGWLIRSRGAVEVRRVEVVLAGDSHEGEKRIAAGVGQRRPHALRTCHVGDRADWPVGGDPFAG